MLSQGLKPALFCCCGRADAVPLLERVGPASFSADVKPLLSKPTMNPLTGYPTLSSGALFPLEAALNGLHSQPRLQKSASKQAGNEEACGREFRSRPIPDYK